MDGNQIYAVRRWEQDDEPEHESCTDCYGEATKSFRGRPYCGSCYELTLADLRAAYERACAKDEREDRR